MVVVNGVVKTVIKNNDATAALKTDGCVVAWGNSYYGGDCSAVQRQLIDVKTIYSTSGAFAALKVDGTVIAWGAGPSFIDMGGDCGRVQAQLVDVQSVYCKSLINTGVGGP